MKCRVCNYEKPEDNFRPKKNGIKVNTCNDCAAIAKSKRVIKFEVPKEATCTKCKATKPISEFNLFTNRPRKMCKKCNEINLRSYNNYMMRQNNLGIEI